MDERAHLALAFAVLLLFAGVASAAYETDGPVVGAVSDTSARIFARSYDVHTGN